MRWSQRPSGRSTERGPARHQGARTRLQGRLRGRRDLQRGRRPRRSDPRGERAHRWSSSKDGRRCGGKRADTQATRSTGWCGWGSATRTSRRRTCCGGVPCSIIACRRTTIFPTGTWRTRGACSTMSSSRCGSLRPVPRHIGARCSRARCSPPCTGWWRSDWRRSFSSFRSPSLREQVTLMVEAMARGAGRSTPK